MSDTNFIYEGIRIESGSASIREESLAVEEALEIRINGEPYTVIMRTPGMELELVHGLLYLEDVYRNPSHLQPTVNERNNLGYIRSINVNVEAQYLGSGYLSGRSLLSVSSCGICGKKELSDIAVQGSMLQTSSILDSTSIFRMFKAMERVQSNFKRTGGCHAAAAFNLQGKLLSSAEDIGRHNAVDKVVGRLLLDDNLKKAKILLVSGRVSYEIVSKAFGAKIPVLAAVSAPSSLAVDYAKELGITLCGFTRGERTTCYSHPERLAEAATAINELNNSESCL